jgi:hypothetical protein
MRASGFLIYHSALQNAPPGFSASLSSPHDRPYFFGQSARLPDKPAQGPLFQPDRPADANLMTAQAVDATGFLDPSRVPNQADGLGGAGGEAFPTGRAFIPDDFRG